jgi:hypothetical protein
VILLKIACVGYSQSSKDTICLPLEVAIKKQKQADSLQVAKQEVSQYKDLVYVTQGRLYAKDSANAELTHQVEFQTAFTLSVIKERDAITGKFQEANGRVNVLNKELRRQKTKTILTGFIGIAATAATFFIASH